MDDLTGTIWFCWSALQEQADGNVTLHLQGEHVGKEAVTACGVPTGGYWHFNVDEGDVAEWQGCRRCMKALRHHRASLG